MRRLGYCILVLLVAQLACKATRHSTPPYDEDPALGAALSQSAAEQCAQSLEGGRRVPERSFVTDGCTAWFDGSWRGCCIEHDRVYWCGGTEDERERADRVFRDCVAETAPEWLAGLMHLGVRFGGHPIWPSASRWSYGRDYLPFYDEFPAGAADGVAE